MNYTHTLYDSAGKLLMDSWTPANMRFAHELSRTISISTSLPFNREFTYNDDVRRYSQLKDFSLGKQTLRTVTRPWSAGLNYSVTFNRFAGNPQQTKTQNLSGHLLFNVTRNWNMNYNGVYGFEEKKMVSQTVEIVRDLHCWEARLVWHPTGYQKDLYIKIDIKDLPEVKVEKAMSY